MKIEKKYKITIPIQSLKANELMKAADFGDGVTLDRFEVSEAKVTWKEGEFVSYERAEAAGQVLKESLEKDGYVGVQVELLK